MNCYICGKTGHLVGTCHHRKSGYDRHNNKKNKGNKIVQEDEFSFIVTKTNMTGEETDWWIDTGATRHICGNITMFTTY